MYLQVDKKDPEVASQGSEKKDAEKNEGDEKKEGEAPEICKRIGRAKDECVLQFNQVRFTSDISIVAHRRERGTPYVPSKHISKNLVIKMQ